MSALQHVPTPALLARYDHARAALHAAQSVDEVKDIRDKAEAMAAYARQAKDVELIQWATEIKVRAERRCGELLRESAEQKSRATRGKPIANAKSTTLVDLEISANQSSRWQKIASMTEEHFETAISTAKEAAGEVTTAFMLRQVEKKPPRTTITGEKAILAAATQIRDTHRADRREHLRATLADISPLHSGPYWRRWLPHSRRRQAR